MRNKKLKLSGLMLASVIIVVSFVYAINAQPVVTGDLAWVETYTGLKNFESYRALTDFLRGVSSPNIHPIVSIDMRNLEFFTNGISLDSSGGKIVDYSQTNVQVTGVDEPDIVKTDGTYLYIVTGNRLLIVKATPAEDAAIECEITVNIVNGSFSILNLFISGSRLVLFVQNYNYQYYEEPFILNSQVEKELSMPICYTLPDTHIQIYELADMKNPELVKDVSVHGNFAGARLIGDYVYLVTNQYSWEIYSLDENETFVPKITVNGETREIPLSDISYIEIPDSSKTLTNVVSVNIHDDTKDVTAKILLLGSTQILYVSKEASV